jgi:hypothetical protein
MVWEGHEGHEPMQSPASTEPNSESGRKDQCKPSAQISAEAFCGPLQKEWKIKIVRQERGRVSPAFLSKESVKEYLKPK